MNLTSEKNIATAGQTIQTAKSLRTLYFVRAAFSITWVLLVAVLAKTSFGIASALFIIYPAWDVVGSI